MELILSCSGNNDLISFIPIVLKGLKDPNNIYDCVEALASCVFVQNVEAPALSITTPILLRGLTDKKTVTKRLACVIVDNMCKLIEHPKEILPFYLDKRKKMHSQRKKSIFSNTIYQSAQDDKSVVWFDENINFNIQLASPSRKQINLATVYNDWLKFSDSFSSLGPINGMHHTENVVFKEDNYTPLLMAKRKNGEEYPLAIASYPEKGRAIWIFTDKLWQLAMNGNGHISRNAYSQIFDSASQWLIRSEINKPLTIEHLSLQEEDNNIFWTAYLKGPATEYIDLKSKDWNISVCDKNLDKNKINKEITGNQSLTLSGKIKNKKQFRKVCSITVNATNKAFGSLEIKSQAPVPKTYKDNDLISSQGKLKELAEIIGAELYVSNNDIDFKIKTWLDNKYLEKGLIINHESKNKVNHFWILDSYILWMLILFLPLEIIIRRWDKLFQTF